MPKRVRMLAEILCNKCTGCRRCAQVCPTVAITMRERSSADGGKGRLVAVMRDEACYNAQACLEICPDQAIVMHEVEKPFDVGMDMEAVDMKAVNDLCSTAGYAAPREICFCTPTTAGEVAAAILAGADAPAKVALITGIRT